MNSLVRIFRFTLPRIKISLIVYTLVALLLGLLDAYFLVKVNTSKFFQSSYANPEKHNLIILLFVSLIFFIRIPNLYLALHLAKKISVLLNKYLLNLFLIFPRRALTNCGSKQLSYLLSIESDLFFEGVLFPLLILTQISFGLFFTLIASAFVIPSTLASILLSFFALALAVSKYVKPFLSKVSLLSSYHRNKFSLKTNQYFENIETIRVLGAGEDYLESLQHDENAYKLNSGLGFLTGLIPKILLETTLFFLVILASLILPLYPAFLEQHQPQIITSLFLIQRILSSSLMIGSSILSLSVNKKRSSGYTKLLSSSLNINMTSCDINVKHIPNSWSKIQLSDCTIELDGTIIQVGSFTIMRGEYIGITGPSGSGKSSFIKLLCGTDFPIAGELYVDDTRYDFSSLISIASLSLQKTFFIYDTLLENMISSHDTTSIDESKLRKIIMVCGLSQICDQYGLNSPLGEFCSSLSGGQQLRLSVARALYTHNSLLVLDEPTSGLDRESSRLLLSNIRKYFPSLTLIVISHSPEDHELCDRVYLKTSVSSPFTLL